MYVYERFVADGRPPTAEETGEALGIGREAAEEGYRRLEQGRVIVLAPGTTNIWLANPLCATPSSFAVEARGRSWWGVCVWDELGIPPMLGDDGVVSTRCPDCGAPIELEIRKGGLAPTPAVVHFAVPAAHWWDNIVFT